MTLVVEDETGLDNAESYLSIADADTYHSNRGNSAWTGSTAVKEAALRKATEYLDLTYSWKGDIFSTTQALNWPRTGISDSQGRELDYTVPQKIKDATAELALASLSSDLLEIQDNSNYIKREKVEGLEVEYKDGSPTGKQYLLVDRMLSGLYSTSYGGSTVKLDRV
jgi:hypothetical protein